MLSALASGADGNDGRFTWVFCVLTIAAQRDSTKKDNTTAHLHERRFTRVRRQFTLPTTVDSTDVDAKLADGVLTLRLKKKDEVKPRKIAIK